MLLLFARITLENSRNLTNWDNLKIYDDVSWDVVVFHSMIKNLITKIQSTFVVIRVCKTKPTRKKNIGYVGGV